MTQSDYFILSFDGGGIRGLIGALLVQQLDQEFDFLKRVDLFAGTSTGALMALGLASGVPISTLVDIYLTKGKEVFKPYTSFSVKPPHELIKKHPSVAAMSVDLLYVKYNVAGLKKILTQTYPAEKTLGQLGRKVLVTSFDLYQTERNAWMPISISNLPGSKNSDIRVLDAALSSGAAPVYFPPHVFQHQRKQKAMVDGGVFANNPSLVAAATVMASGTLKRRGLAFENIKLLSLGTGFTLDGIPPKNLWTPDWYGVLAWMYPFTNAPTPQFPLLPVLMDGVSEVATFQCRQLFGHNFRRGNVHLKETINLDDYEKVGELKKWTEAYMASAEWKEIKQWVGRKSIRKSIRGSARKSTPRKTKTTRKRVK